MGKLLKVFLMPHPPIMVNEVGKGREEEVNKTISAAMAVSNEIKELKPDTVIIVVPPHGPAFGDAISINTDKVLTGSLSNFGAPKVEFEYNVDMELTNIIMRNSAINKIPIVPVDLDSSKRYKISNKLDHGSMVPLYFIGKEYKEFKLVHITYGLLSHEDLYLFGSTLRQSIEESDKNVILITSGDLSHKLTHDAPAGYSPMGEKFDKALVEYLKAPDSDSIMDMDKNLVDSAGECGYRSILVMLGTLDGLKVHGSILSYEGPFGVGYCIAGYDIIAKDQNNNKVDYYFKRKKEKLKDVRDTEDAYVQLARNSLEYYIRNGKRMILPADAPLEMINKQAGTFVSIKKSGELRGCIGTIEPVRPNIASEIIENAVSAGISDPRFYPVDEDELDDLVYSVDVLGKPEPIESSDELNTEIYGVIVRKARRSGLLLPNLEGIETVDEQLSVVLRKAGIDGHEDYTMERFEVIRHK
jgi:MEMO1 family protein